MWRRAEKLIPVLLAAVLFMLGSVTASALELPGGSVRGLPEKLVVLDSEGKSARENGEYYFEVLNMKSAETYTKKVQLMNLREDASYHMYFGAEPVEKNGDIDLEKECKCTIFLDNKQVYGGKITGEGEPDIRKNGLDLGVYDPGDSHVLKIDIVWIDGGTGKSIDHGARRVDSSGVTVTREGSGKTHIEGEVIFLWKFYAQVEPDDDKEKSSNPPQESSGSSSEGTSQVSQISTDESGKTSDSGESSGKRRSGDTPEYVQTGEMIAYFAMGIVAAATLLLIILILGRKKKKKE